MSREEPVELTVACALYQGDRILLQESLRKDWAGLCLPGGHVEKTESFIEAVKREFLEETGLRILDPHLCGVKQFFNREGFRYIVILFDAHQYEGELKDSEEGKNAWYPRAELAKLPLVDDLFEQLKVMENDEFSEYYGEPGKGGLDYVKK